MKIKCFFVELQPPYATTDYQTQLKNIMTNTRLYTIWQLCTLNQTSFRSKARAAKLWELSFQGTEFSPQNCQIEVQRRCY